MTAILVLLFGTVEKLGSKMKTLTGSIVVLVSAGLCPNPESHIVWDSQECDVPPAYQLKQTTTATATKTSLQNITLSYSKYFMIIPSWLYYTIWAKCPINGLIWTDLK